MLKGKVIRELLTRDSAPSASTIELLKSLYRQDVEFNKEIISPLQTPFIIPSFSELRKQVAMFSCPVLFSCLGLHAFNEVLSNVLLERNILFVSENLNYLTSAVYIY